MDIVKVTNAGIKVGSYVVPVLKIVIDDMPAYPSNYFTHADIDEVVRLSIGFTCMTGFGVDYGGRQNVPQGVKDYPTGAETFGDDNGFKLVRTVSHAGRDQGWNNLVVADLFYKGSRVARGGSSLYGTSCCMQPLPIMVDSRNNIYTLTYGGAMGSTLGEFRQSTASGVAVPGIMPVYLLDENVPVTSYPGTAVYMTLSANDISADISGEIDPSITDPYETGGGESGPGGGTGTFSETGDTIGIPGLPTLSAVDTGFITLFNPSAAQVKALANYMWSSSFDLATFKNIVANPIDCILGLTIVPVSPSSAGNKTVTVGNIPTDVTLPYLSSQYVEVDCGTLNVQEFWGSYLDYSPYTKMSLYLPYIGIIPLDIDDVMNASISIKYHVDVLSGACVAYVLCNGTQLYTYVGQCSSNVPITSNDFTNTVNGILGIAGALGKLSADGGASAPTAISEVAANAINALKPNIQKSGAMSGTGGLMGVQTPYLICQRPRQSVPHNQNAYTGYPANITAKLSDLSGYTEVESIHLDGLSATQEEQQEIMDLLTSGVII